MEAGQNCLPRQIDINYLIGGRSAGNTRPPQAFRLGRSLDLKWTLASRRCSNGKGHALFKNVAFIYAGNDLLSHTLSRAVQSAQRDLTSVFGMGTGGTPAVRLPTSSAASY